LGTLCLSGTNAEGGVNEAPDEDKVKFYEAVSENLALAIANLQLQEKLRYQALRDPLTGLRRYLQVALERELERSTCRGHPLSLLLFNIDHFKQFNDSFGHAAGDTALNRLGSVLKEWSRPDDILVRFGGEEFTVVLPETSADEARVRAESLRQIVEELMIEHEGAQLRHVTISVGVAACPMHGQDRDALIEKADQALYRSKKTGRNRVTVALGAIQNIEAAAPLEIYRES
jgi:diguanylate cyclase (GGDEF)-like protein